MGPYGGGWALIRNGEMPSKMATERGAPARLRRATPAAIIDVTSATFPMLTKTPKSRKRMFSEKSWVKSSRVA